MAGREPKDFTIAGTVYRITPLGADTGGQLLFRAGRGIAIEDLKPEDFSWAVERFKECTRVGIVDEKGARDRNGNAATRWVTLASVMDEQFAANYEAYFEWLKASWEVNFGNFLGGVLGRLAQAKALSESPSPKAAPGLPGDSSSTSA